MNEPLSNTPTVIVFPRGQLSAEDKALLSLAGIVGVEADDPKAVVQLRITEFPMPSSLPADSILQAALQALVSSPAEDSSGFISGTGRACHGFVKSLAQAAVRSEVGAPQ